MSDKVDNSFKKFIEQAREEGVFKDEASDAAPDYDRAFDNTEGQRYVERKREAAQALPEPELSLSERVKRFASKLYRCVFQAPYFRWPKPDFDEVVDDPLAYTGKEPERLMELAGIDPDDEPFTGVAPDVSESPNQFLPETAYADDEFQRRAFEVIRERAENADRGFYEDAVKPMEEATGDDGGFHEFLGNALMNETAESSGWVEDKAGISLQDVVDRTVGEIEGRSTVDPDEFESFVRESQGVSESDYPFALDNFGDVEALYGVVSEALAHSGDYSIDPNRSKKLDDSGAREEAFTDVIRTFGRVYHEAIKINNTQNND